MERMMLDHNVTYAPKYARITNITKKIILNTRAACRSILKPNQKDVKIMGSITETSQDPEDFVPKEGIVYADGTGLRRKDSFDDCDIYPDIQQIIDNIISMLQQIG